MVQNPQDSKIGNCLGKILEIIEEIPVISETQKQFNLSIVEYKYANVLLPIYQKLTE